MAPRTALQLLDEEEPDEELTLVTDEDDAAEAEQPLKYGDDEPNLVPIFMGSSEGRRVLSEIARQVYDDFDRDWESAEEYRDKNTKVWRLFEGHLPKKSWPYENSANVHVPMAFENLTRVIFRAYDELFGDWSNVFGVVPLGPDDQQVAEILTKHGNWQITNQIEDFKRQQFRAMMMYFVPGDVVFHSYYDPLTRKNVHEALTCDEFVVPYTNVTTSPSYADVPRRSKVLYMHRHQLQARRDTWHGVDDVIAKKPSPWEEDPESVWVQSRAEVVGIQMPTDDERAPYKLIQYEGWTDKLPNQKRDRFIQAILDYRTKRLLSLVIYEEADWQDQLRYDRQMQEMQQYDAARMEHAQMMQELPAMREELLLEAGMRSDAGNPFDPMMVEQQLGELDPARYPEPPPPTWMEQPGQPPQEPRKVPLQLFTHGVCIEPIVGNLGQGFGKMEADLNRAANVLWSQYIDAMTLANVWGLITAGNVDFERPFSFKPGHINKATGVQGAQLKDSIMELRPQQANPQMVDAADRLYQWGQSAASAADVLSGEAGKSGETAQGIMARIEQATKMISVPTRTYAIGPLTDVLKKNAYLNSVFLPDDEIVEINNHLIGMAEQIQIGRKLYERNYMTQIKADLRFASRAQRVAEADEIGVMTQDPMMATNVAFKQRAMAKALKARGQHDMVPYLGPELPPPETPMGIVAQPQTPPDADPNAPPQEGAPQLQ